MQTKDLAASAGVVVMFTAVARMLAGSAMSIVGTIVRRPRVGMLGARLGLAGPGLACVGAGIYAAGLPWPVAPFAVLPVTFGALLFWFALRARIKFVGRR